MDQSVVAFDLQRMLIGDGPPLFYLEIVARTVIIYVYTLVLLRWLGSRTVGQLSTIEFLLVIALGSAVGDAMFYPDVPLLHALAVVTLVVVLNKGLDTIMLRSPRAERLIDGEPREVIRDGVVDASFLREGPISAYELFQRLREDGIEQLGEVRRAYMERTARSPRSASGTKAAPACRSCPRTPSGSRRFVRRLSRRKGRFRACGAGTSGPGKRRGAKTAAASIGRRACADARPPKMVTSGKRRCAGSARPGPRCPAVWSGRP